MHIIFQRVLALCVFLVAGFQLQAQQNIILLIADDVSPEYFGFYNTNTDTAKAPNLRALANNSVRFTRVWASPICSPTRAGILTGRYSFRTGVGAVVTGPTSAQLDTNEMSIAKLLKVFGPTKYATACIGKWHLNDATLPKRQYPRRFGYDLYSGNFLGALTNFYSYQRITNGVLDTVTTYATTQTINDAIAWLDTLSGNKPFFLWLGFNAPHSPFHLPPANLCDTTGLPGTTADIQANPKKYYKAAIQALDTEIGRLLTYLDAHNLRDSTHIIFMGDNGSDQQTAQIPTPTKAKGTLYDYGVHVPLIISGPAVSGAPRVNTDLWNTVDLFASMAEMGRFTQWANAIPNGNTIDSRSMLSALRQNNYTPRTWIFSEQFNTPSIAADGKTIRDTAYHLQRFTNGNEALFRYATDSLEDLNILANQATMTSTDWQHYYALCDTLSNLTNTLPCWATGLSETEVSEIILYPNPSRGNCSIRGLYGTWQIRLIDATGKTEYNGLWQEGQSIPLQHIPKGVYWLQAQQGTNTRSAKLIWAGE
ncbi:MAG: sulfatase-like hydrolase/transferase [Chitinophagaceae bacterium]